MKAVAGMLVLKLLSLAGALALLTAVIGLFAFRDILGPRLPMLFAAGAVALAIGEGGSRWLARQLETRD